MRKISDYVWYVTRVSFEILVVLYVFSKLDQRNETITVAILGIIYAGILRIGLTRAISDDALYIKLEEIKKTHYAKLF